MTEDNNQNEAPQPGVFIVETMPFTMEMPVFKGLKSAAEIANMTRKERESYILEYDAYRTGLAAWDYAITESRAEGREEGREEGRAEGERNKTYSIALAMKLHGDTVDYISLITGLTPAEIDKL